MKALFALFFLFFSTLVLADHDNMTQSWGGDYDAQSGHYNRSANTTVIGHTQSGGSFTETHSRAEDGYSSYSPAQAYPGFPGSVTDGSLTPPASQDVIYEQTPTYCHGTYRRPWWSYLWNVNVDVVYTPLR